MSDDNALTLKKQGELIHAIDQNGMDTILKPLTKEIYLFDTYIAGTSHIDDQSVFDDIKAGDSLILQREQNKYDDKAIVVKTKDKKKLGYIPERDNAIFSRLMDAGKMLTAHVDSIEKKGSYILVNIKIYLVDF